MTENAGFQDAIISFLSREENLKVALVVGEHIQTVKDQLHERFWEIVQDRMEERMREEGIDGWEVRKREAHGITERCGGIYLCPADYRVGDFAILPNAEQWRKSARLRYGLWPFPWKEQSTEPLPTMSRRLQDKFRDKEGFSSRGVTVSHRTDIRARSREALLDVARAEAGEQTSSLAVDFADEFLIFFLEHQEYIEGLNRDVAQYEREASDATSPSESEGGPER